MDRTQWTEIGLPADYREAMHQRDCHEMRAFQRGPVRCLISRNGMERLWHLSISCEKRYPSWEEQKKARYDLLPDEITVASYLPPKSEYVNIHENCFHWIEVREPKLIIP